MNDLVTYTPPSSSELEQTWQLANKLARTEFVPKTMRGEHGPEAVLACMLTGRELGIGPMQSLRDVYLVNGRPSLSATLMVARVRAQGHKFRTLENTDHHATVQIHRAREQQPEPPITFSVEDAKRAKLISKDVWQQYPARMLWARAASAACRRDCPEVLGGAVYTPEELEDETETTWGEVEVDQTTGEVLKSSDRLGGDPNPAQPAGPSVPTLDQVKQIRSVRAAKELVQGAAEPFRSKVPAAIDALHHGDERLADPRDFWALGDFDQWRQVLEYTVELYLHDHETTAEGHSPRPSAAQTSGPVAEGEAAAGPGNPTTDSGHHAD